MSDRTASGDAGPEAIRTYQPDPRRTQTLRCLAHRDTIEGDLTGFFQTRHKGHRLESRRKRVARSNAGVAPETDRHLTRLRGREDVERRRIKPASLESAVKLAIELQCVTPVSGEVALERQEQYGRHGLKPADAGTVPLVPEPNAVARILAGSAWLGVRRNRRPITRE